MIRLTVSLVLFSVLHGFVLSSAVDARPRAWKSLNGDVTIDGELIGANETTVVLKRKGSGRLVAIELAELVPEDRAWVQQQIVDDPPARTDDPQQMQTWTSRDGLKIQARVVAYGRKVYTLGRTRGVVTINGIAFSAMEPLQRSVVLKVLSKLEKTAIATEADLKRFVTSLRGTSREYPLEGVLMELATGDQIAVPFFMFSDQDLAILKSGWNNWLEAEESAKSREDLMMRSEAMAYQDSTARQAEHQQLEILKLNMLAARTGLTSIWEVQLKPNPGVFGRPIRVMVTARNSAIATQMVLPNYPGYSLIGVRRASR